MRIAFAGTPDFAVPALDALHAAGHDIAAVFTQPDRPAGRGRRLRPSPVAERADALGLPVHKPTRFDDAARAQLVDAAVEVLVVVAYGLILPQAVLDTPVRGCLNIHASLLPRWRGAAPIQRAVEAGDSQTGVCIMQMEAGLDTGPVWRRAALAIGEHETAGELHDRLAQLGAREIVPALAQVAAADGAPEPQPAEGVTYARKLAKDEARVDWSASAATIARRVRAFNPVPGAWTGHDGERLRVLRARPAEPVVTAAAGTVLGVDHAGVRVATGEGALLLETLQWPGARALPAFEAAGRRLVEGAQLT